MEMVSKGMLEPEKMPPTQRAAYFHGLRAHLQIVTWKLLGCSPGPGITNVLTHFFLCVSKKMAIICNH